MNKTEAQLVKELYNLHEVRRSMSYSSMYHGVYVDMIIELNNKLVKLTSKSYADYSLTERDNLIAEAHLLAD